MITFIINPSSGGGRSLKVWKKLEKYLYEKNISYEAFITKYKGEAGDIVLKICEKSDGNTEDTVVAVGGDGTVNDMLRGICTNKKLIYGHIPTGTGNDLARGLGLPKSPLACLKKIINKDRVKEIDYGILSYGTDGHKRFLVSSGIGFDASIVNEYSSLPKNSVFSKGLFRKISYLKIGIKHFFKTDTSKGFVIVEGIKKIEFNHIFFVVAHVHPYEGGGIKFAPDAINTDGELDVCLMHGKSKFNLAKILILSLLGKHLKNKGVRYGTCEDMHIHLEKPSFVHADGEYCGKYTDITVSCVKNKLRFIC